MKQKKISDSAAKTVVFYDGSCPLCEKEIGIYRGHDIKGVLSFVDVSNPNATLPEVLDREKAMSRFHVRTQNGHMVSGAAAFIEVWQQLRGWRWAAKLSTIPGLTTTLEFAYRVSLRFRPALVLLFVAISRWKGSR